MYLLAIAPMRSDLFSMSFPALKIAQAQGCLMDKALIGGGLMVDAPPMRFITILPVIRMPLPEAVPDSVGDAHEFRRFADVQRPVAGKIAFDDVVDAPRAGRHDDDVGRQEHRFRNG